MSISITPTHGHGHSQRFASKYWKKSLVRQKTVLTNINLLFKTKFVIQKHAGHGVFFIYIHASVRILEFHL
jgi:hypothetical protein